MGTNVSSADRIARVVLAVVLALAAVYVGAGSVLGIVLLVLAVVFAATAAIGFCPLYKVFGFSTKS